MNSCTLQYLATLHKIDEPFVAPGAPHNAVGAYSLQATHVDADGNLVALWNVHVTEVRDTEAPPPPSLEA